MDEEAIWVRVTGVGLLRRGSVFRVLGIIEWTACLRFALAIVEDNDFVHAEDG